MTPTKALLGDLTQAQLREVELEENLRRKDLTEIERSRDLVALAETVTETCGAIPRVSRNGSRGPAPDPTSTRQIAGRIGVDEKTIRNAREHVAAVEQYPQFEPLPQAEAIRAARSIRQPLDLDILPRLEAEATRATSRLTVSTA